MSDLGSNSIIPIYFIGTLGMLLLAISIFFFFVTYQKRMLKKQLELNETLARQQEEIIANTILAQENERKRIARDLHDEVGAMLSVVKLNVSRIEKRTEETVAKQLAADTKQYLDDVITQVRRISRALLPPSLQQLGLWSAIEELASWVNKSEQMKIECRKKGEPFRFDSAKELAFFRIVQELINNAIKHSMATTICINFRFRDDVLVFSVADNGRGFDLENKATGLGLKNLESRSNMAGAKFKMKSWPGKGTRAVLYYRIKEAK
jgi:signal transduction histidine kinase